MVKKQQYLVGIVVMVWSSIFFSMMAGLIRYVSHIDSFTTSLFRFAIGLALLGTLAMLKKIKLMFIRSKLLFLRGFFGGVAVFLFYLSISKIGISKGTVILYSYPIFATIGGVIFLGEKVSPRKWFVILFSFVGIYLISTSEAQGLSGFGKYDSLAIMGALCAGMSVVLVKKLRDTDSSYAIFFAQSAVGFWLVILPANGASSEIGMSGGIILLAIGITAAVGQLMMTYAYRHLPVSTGSLLGMLVPVFNISIGVIGFNEDISRRCISGIIIVLVSCVLVIVGKEGGRLSITG